MQQTNGVAALATHLAATDRRALSQAWYSALHLAGAAPRARPARSTLTSSTSASSTRRAPHSAGDPAQPRGRDPRCGARDRFGSRRDVSPAGRGNASASDRMRQTQSANAARSFTSGLARRVLHGLPSSCAVSAAGGRIHLFVRDDGVRMRVVAVCAPALRERVERALAGARFALARCGVRAEAA
jgi:hypothetical protein